jgi:hypothetical protein
MVDHVDTEVFDFSVVAFAKHGERATWTRVCETK